MPTSGPILFHSIDPAVYCMWLKVNRYMCGVTLVQRVSWLLSGGGWKMFKIWESEIRIKTTHQHWLCTHHRGWPTIWVGSPETKPELRACLTNTLEGLRIEGVYGKHTIGRWAYCVSYPKCEYTYPQYCVSIVARSDSLVSHHATSCEFHAS
jgi:hypothetical protein